MLNETDIESLQDWLSQNPAIPKIPPRERTLMDIMSIDHHENQWSAIYAFFLNPYEDHGLGDLFIRSLEELRPEIKDWLQSFEIKTEKPVTDGQRNGRIDILLKDETNRKAIIIENKVYHTPEGNPFDLYREKLKGYAFQNIKLMLLTLRPIDIKAYKNIPDDCIPFTHLEYMNLVMRNKDKYGTCKDAKYEILLNEFYTNIKNLSYHMDKESLSFYYENYPKLYQVNQVFKIMEEEYSKLLKQQAKDDFGDKILRDGKIYSNETTQWFYLKYKEQPTVCLTVFPFYEEEGKKYIRIILELQTANTIHQIEKNEKELKDKFKASEHFQYLTTRDKGYWWHFAQELIPLDDKVLLPYELLDKLKSDVAQMDIYKLGAEIVKKTE